MQSGIDTMKRRANAVPPSREVMIALMGPTGTGKSAFINLLTQDDDIRVGHELESQTFNVTVSHWVDHKSGVLISLVDTPGFDDSRGVITDTDILQKVADFLQENGGRKLNGIIYLHRISDPRVGGVAKMNLSIFRELCGDDVLGNVRLVTTNWNRVGEKEGNNRETELRNRVFKPFLDGGAQLLRHDNGLVSAQSIVSTLIHKTPVTMKIQTELNAGKALGDTSAGAIIIAEMKALQRKHGKEIEDLKKEMVEAEVGDANLRAELAVECQNLEQLMARAEDDQRRLAMVYVPRTIPRPPPPPILPTQLPRSNGKGSVDAHKEMSTPEPMDVIPRTTLSRTPLKKDTTESVGVHQEISNRPTAEVKDAIPRIPSKPKQVVTESVNPRKEIKSNTSATVPMDAHKGRDTSPRSSPRSPPKNIVTGSVNLYTEISSNMPATVPMDSHNGRDTSPGTPPKTPPKNDVAESINLRKAKEISNGIPATEHLDIQKGPPSDAVPKLPPRPPSRKSVKADGGQEIGNKSIAEPKDATKGHDNIPLQPENGCNPGAERFVEARHLAPRGILASVAALLARDMEQDIVTTESYLAGLKRRYKSLISISQSGR